MDFIPLVEKGVIVPRATVQAMLSRQHQHSLDWSVLLCFASNHWVINVLGFLPPSLQSTNTWSGFLLGKSAAAEQMRMSSLISSVRKETQVFKCKSFPKIFPPALQACDLNNTHTGNLANLQNNLAEWKAQQMVALALGAPTSTAPGRSICNAAVVAGCGHDSSYLPLKKAGSGINAAQTTSRKQWSKWQPTEGSNTSVCLQGMQWELCVSFFGHLDG